MGSSKSKKGKSWIPEPPKVEKPLVISGRDIKFRKKWARNPATQVGPKLRKDQESRCSNKGNLRERIEREMDEDDD